MPEGTIQGIDFANGDYSYVGISLTNTSSHNATVTISYQDGRPVVYEGDLIENDQLMVDITMKLKPSPRKKIRPRIW